jgi:archaeal flagellin FlaB
MAAKYTHRNYIEGGFTGLEAAIVLIAFVVVAAVFSYVVLGAGFFTTQKSQETVHTSIQQASSSLEIVGGVFGIAAVPATGIDTVKFTVANTAGGTAVDVSKLTISYLVTGGTIENLDDNTGTTPGTLKACTLAGVTAGHWAVTAIYNDNQGSPNDFLLSPGEQFVICVSPTSVITTNQEFTINLQPAVGAVFPIKRTAPAALTAVNTLY